MGKATPEPASPAPASPQGEGEGGGEALVTQRDEEIENYQSTVKERLLNELREEKEARTTAADDLKITSI